MMRSPSLALSPVVSVSRTTWRVIVVRDPPIRESVCALVFRMPGMAAHPVPLYLMLGRDPVELLPQVDVLDRLLVGGAPAAAPPVVGSGGAAPLHVERVRIQAHAARALQRLERPDHRHQLHAVVGGVGLAAVDFLLGAFGAQDRAPAAGAGVAAAGAVAVDLHDIVTRHDGFGASAGTPGRASGAARAPRGRRAGPPAPR